jgi:hypothetical protein
VIDMSDTTDPRWKKNGSAPNAVASEGPAAGRAPAPAPDADAEAPVDPLDLPAWPTAAAHE